MRGHQRQAMLAKYGGEEGFKEHMRAIGAKGGANVKPEQRAFSKNRQLASQAGIIGGKLSKPGKRT